MKDLTPEEKSKLNWNEDGTIKIVLNLSMRELETMNAALYEANSSDELRSVIAKIPRTYWRPMY